MASIDKRADGRWRARWREYPGGPQRARHFAKKSDAERFLTGVQADLLRGAYVDPWAGRVTFADYAERWLAAQPYRATTLAGYRTALDVHLLPTFGTRPLSSIRTSDVRAWVAGLAAAGLAPSTVNGLVMKLRAVLSAAVDDGLIARSPAAGRAVKVPTSERGDVHPLSPDQVAALHAAMPERLRAFVVLMAGSGVRPAEALGLTVDRVDFLRRTVRIDRQLVTVANAEPALAPTKTPQSVRTVPVPEVVTEALAAHLARWPAGGEGFVFTNNQGRPWRRNALGHAWRRARVRAGLPDANPHDLRHYAASVLIAEGASVKLVQRTLGHKSAVTTLDVYGHLFPDSDDVARRALATAAEGLCAAVGSGS